MVSWGTLERRCHPSEVYTRCLYHRNAQWPTLAEELEENTWRVGPRSPAFGTEHPDYQPASMRKNRATSNWGCSVYHGGYVAGNHALTSLRALVCLQRLMSAVPWPGALKKLLSGQSPADVPKREPVSELQQGKYRGRVNHIRFLYKWVRIDPGSWLWRRWLATRRRDWEKIRPMVIGCLSPSP